MRTLPLRVVYVPPETDAAWFRERGRITDEHAYDVVLGDHTRAHPYLARAGGRLIRDLYRGNGVRPGASAMATARQRHC